MNELVRYDAMCSAIAECHAVDEVLNIKDKARALEVYAMQVKNTEAERKACDVRLRAERRVGQLLAELTRTPPQEASIAGRAGNESLPMARSDSPYARALADNRISTQSASRYQRLAQVPAEDFEDALAGAAKPSTTRLITQARDPVPKIGDPALWVWGQLREFERDGYVHLDARELLDGMTETMRDDVRRIAPLMAGFLNLLTEVDDEQPT